MKIAFLIAGLCLVIFSCSEKMFVADAAFEQKSLPFIIDGQADKESIILKLGEPSWSFENGRILTYRLVIDRKGNVSPVRITNTKNDWNYSTMAYSSLRYYSLVLVFDEKNILAKHSLLLTNP